MKLKLIFFILLIFLCGQKLQSQNREIDSINNLFNQKNNDKIAAELYYQLSEYYGAVNLDTTIYLCNKSIKLADEQLQKELSEDEVKSFLKTKASALNNKGYYYRQKGVISLALNYFFKSLAIRKHIDDKKGIAESFSNIGYVYNNIGEVTKALSFHTKSLKIRQSINDFRGQATSLNRIAVIYAEQAEKLTEKKNSKSLINKKINQALGYHYKSLSLRQKLGDKEKYAESLNSIGLVHFSIMKELVKEHIDADSIKKESERVNKYFTNSFKLRTAIADQKGIAECLNNLAKLNLFNNQNNIAKKYALESLSIAQKIGFPEQIRNAASCLNQIYEREGSVEAAYKMFKLFILMRDSLQNYSTVQKQFQDDFKRKLEADSLKMVKQEKKLAHTQLKQEQSYRWYLITFVILIGVFGVMAYKRYKITIKQNRVINMQHQAVEKQRNQIALKNEEILASINYAKRIQATILPSERKILKNIPNSFVLYLPKDIISGDFYWIEADSVNPHIVYFAVCDCTGHGVPGALVSLVCSNALNRAVKEIGLKQPSLILDCAADLIIENFSKNNKVDDEIKDGMDVALCSLNTQTGLLSFAGANNPIWIIKENNSLEVLKGNKQPIGKTENRLPFTNHTYQLSNNDTVYLFTDGYADQFGGDNGKKLQRVRFKELIEKISNLPLPQQQQELLNFFETYKGKFEQIDDVCVMAVKFVNANKNELSQS